MAKLAKDWLANSYTITRQLEPLERCLSDGYILTSVCRQQGLIDEMDFEQYAVNIPGPDSATENFKLLAKALRKVNLKLTKKDVAGMYIFSPFHYLIQLLPYLSICFQFLFVASYCCINAL